MFIRKDIRLVNVSDKSNQIDIAEDVLAVTDGEVVLPKDPDVPPWAVDPDPRLAQAICDRFIMSNEYFYLQNKDGSYSPSYRPLTDTDLIKHLKGKQTVSAICSDKLQSKALTFDVDEMDFTKAQEIYFYLWNAGFMPVMEYSGLRFKLYLFADTAYSLDTWRAWEKAELGVMDAIKSNRLTSKHVELLPHDLRHRTIRLMLGYNRKPRPKLDVPDNMIYHPRGSWGRTICPWGDQIDPLREIESPMFVGDISRDLECIRKPLKPRINVKRTECNALSTLITKGVREPGRDLAAFKLACRLKEMGINEDTARIQVRKFASNCTPPFPQNTADRKVVSAYSDSYRTSCWRWIEDRLCDRSTPCSTTTTMEHSTRLAPLNGFLYLLKGWGHHLSYSAISVIAVGIPNIERRKNIYRDEVLITTYKEIADESGVPRTSVREILIELASCGLISLQLGSPYSPTHPSGEATHILRRHTIPSAPKGPRSTKSLANFYKKLNPPSSDRKAPRPKLVVPRWVRNAQISSSPQDNRMIVLCRLAIPTLEYLITKQQYCPFEVHINDIAALLGKQASSAHRLLRQARDSGYISCVQTCRRGYWLITRHATQS